MPGIHVTWEQDRPALRAPVMIAAFEGWNDAADAASNAVSWLRHRWHATHFATIDPDPYYDFQASRPRVSVRQGVVRSVRWPSNEFFATALPAHHHDVVLLSGVEPNVHWQDFCRDVIDVAQATGCEMVVTLGALLAVVPHTRPVRLTTTAVDRELSRRLHLQRSRYEGPTGIVGVLHDACHRAGLASISLWVPVPHYVATPPNPKATAALLDHLGQLLHVDVDDRDLHAAASAWELRVSELVAADDDVAAYVHQLEEQTDMVFGDGEGDDDGNPGGSGYAEDATGGHPSRIFDAEIEALSGDEIGEEFERYLRERESGDDT